LFDRLLCDVARLRRQAAGRAPEPTLGIIDTQSVTCIPVRGPRGYDAGKKVLGRKRAALVDADGVWLGIAVVAADTQERDTLPALDAGKAEWPSLRAAVLDGGFIAERCREWCNLHGMHPHGSSAIQTRRASSCWRAAGWSSAVSGGSPTGG
jgi:putative transposase